MEQYQDLTFVDVTQPFDTLSNGGLWNNMSKFGCPERFVKIIRQFDDGMMSRVLDDRNVSDICLG